LDGRSVDDVPTLDLLRGDMNKSYSNSKHQGTDSEVIIRTFKLASIKAITIDHETHVVEK
jgi:uncharacterized protein affecting Mg2+/Co2+ transport